MFFQFYFSIKLSEVNVKKQFLFCLKTFRFRWFSKKRHLIQSSATGSSVTAFRSESVD